MSSDPSIEDKLKKVLEKNTFFLPNNEFGEQYEKDEIQSKVNLLLKLQKEIHEKGVTKEVIVNFIQNNKDGLECLFTLTGLSREVFKRVITLIRIKNDPVLNTLINISVWPTEDFENEWTDKKIVNLAQKHRKIAEGIINIFFDGASNPLLKKSLETFELNKLDVSKFMFTTESLLDTLTRYKMKGSFSGLKENNPEVLIEKILNKNKIRFTAGLVSGIPRRMDFIIPDTQNPKILIEVSKLRTTASGMGDKAKTEGKVAEEIERNYPTCIFIGFVDGIGWYVRQGDLKRMVSAYHDVFTFDSSELNRFEIFLQHTLTKDCYDAKK